jgi:hypothetical protein
MEARAGGSAQEMIPHMGQHLEVVNYLRRKVDTGYDRALIRTVGGVGYQIGGIVARSATAWSSSAGSL